MDHKRKMELLAYAIICFEKCTNPFALMHLQKKNVDADECRDLSQEIADLLEIAFLNEGVQETKELMSQAHKEFMETQE